MPNSNILYIIGNGFDLAHEMKTKYQDFKTWLLANGQQVFVQRIETLYPEIVNGKGEWNDIERALGIFEMPNVIAFDKSYTDCPCQENVRNDTGANIKSVTVVLPTLLRKWITSICLDDIKQHYTIEPDSFFINFNYTETLEQVYKIDSKRVFHIHGSILETSQELVLGYKPEDDLDNDVLNASQIDADSIRHNLMTNMIKPIRLCKNKLHCHLPHLEQIDEVRVIGHSCSRIDEDYFLDIAKSISKKAVWIFYIYDDTMTAAYDKFASRITNQDGIEQKYEIKNCKEIVI